MTTNWATHTTNSHPGRHAGLVRELPIGVATACTVARNVIGHYGTDFSDLRAPQRDEVNLRSLARILDTDQARHPRPLDEPRDPESRVPGCCRDHALFVVGVLREQGIPALTRVGFADYLVPGRRIDHVVVEYWSGDRWIRADPEMVPDAVPFNPADMDVGADAPFQTATDAWQGCRSGRVDFDRYPVPPGSGFSDSSHVIRTYVALELAHRNREELLLWDTWPGLDAFDDDLVDKIAGLLTAADLADSSAEADLSRLYSRFGPGGVVTQLSPYGEPPRQVNIAPDASAR